MPDACYPLVCLLCVWGGVSSRGAVLAAFAPSWRCPQSSLFLFYKIQLSTGCRWYRCDSARRRGGTRRKAESVGSPPLIIALRASLLLVYAAAIAGGGSRRASRCSPARAAGGAPRSSTCSNTGGPARAIYSPRLCRLQTDSPSSTDVPSVFSAESDRALLSRSSHGLPGLPGGPRDVLRGGRSWPEHTGDQISPG